MSPRPLSPAEEAIGELDTDVEAVTVQLRAANRAIEALGAAIDALATSLPGGVPAAVTQHVEVARWELKRLS